MHCLHWEVVLHSSLCLVVSNYEIIKKEELKAKQLLSIFVAFIIANPAPVSPPFPTGPSIKWVLYLQTKCQYKLSQAKSHELLLFIGLLTQPTGYFSFSHMVSVFICITTAIHSCLVCTSTIFVPGIYRNE